MAKSKEIWHNTDPVVTEVAARLARDGYKVDLAADQFLLPVHVDPEFPGMELVAGSTVSLCLGLRVHDFEPPDWLRHTVSVEGLRLAPTPPVGGSTVLGPYAVVGTVVAKRTEVLDTLWQDTPEERDVAYLLDAGVGFEARAPASWAEVGDERFVTAWIESPADPQYPDAKPSSECAPASPTAWTVRGVLRDVSAYRPTVEGLVAVDRVGAGPPLWKPQGGVSRFVPCRSTQSTTDGNPGNYLVLLERGS